MLIATGLYQLRNPTIVEHSAGRAGEEEPARGDALGARARTRACKVRRDLGTRRWRTVTVYAVTSLTAAQASPARLADLIWGHWGIEICQAGCAYGM
jgi:hypothetical protein